MKQVELPDVRIRKILQIARPVFLAHLQGVEDMNRSIGALPCSDMMFCATLSNVLENAMHAVQELPEEKRFIILSLSEKARHLLLMEKNAIGAAPVFADGIPVTERSGHGLGARSIVYYVERLKGQYQFLTENGDYVVRIIL